ncbi:MAG: PadR family transcriptional regulator [Acidimicrobiales bacterium]|jgi:DNA-binding PadR family transcriptional regulator
MAKEKDIFHGGPVDLNPTAGSILGFLATFGSMTGWDLDQAIDGSIGNFWNVTRSQVYRELRDLATRGLVAHGEPGPRDRTPYAITETGLMALHAWLERDPGPGLIRNRLLLTVFFSDQVAPSRLAEILAAQRAEHEGTLARFQELQRDVGTEGAMAATLRFGISYQEMVVAWIDSIADLVPNEHRQHRRR